MSFWKKMEKMCKDDSKVKVINKGTGMGGIYCAAGLGVLIYYLNMAHSITDVIVAFIKAILWPAFVAYHTYGLLGMH